MAVIVFHKLNTSPHFPTFLGNILTCNIITSSVFNPPNQVSTWYPNPKTITRPAHASHKNCLLQLTSVYTIFLGSSQSPGKPFHAFHYLFSSLKQILITQPFPGLLACNNKQIWYTFHKKILKHCNINLNK